MDKASDEFIRVATLDELKAKGRMVVGGRHCPLLVVYENGRVHALDNRCPHLGFPLNRGTIDVELSDDELAARRKAWTPRPTDFGSGALWRYAQTVGPAAKGAVTHPGASAETHVYADI